MANEEVHDTSRLDAFLASRRRATVLNAVWRPMLAGAVGASLVVACVYVTLPKVSYREIEVPKVTMRDVVVPNILPHDVEVDRVVPHETIIEIPKIVTTAEPPQSPEAFIDSAPFRSATIKGRFAGPDRNGFRLDNGQVFYPARSIGGRVELATDMLDDVSKLTIGDPIYCAPMAPEGLFECQAWHRGRVERIEAIPVGRPRWSRSSAGEW
jgi:hypothetical protein